MFSVVIIAVFNIVMYVSDISLCAGISSGNYRRIRTNDVICMPGMSNAASVLADSPLPSQVEEHLQTLAKKQLKTDLTFDEYAFAIYSSISSN